jgi:hypothetical protein
VRHWSQGGETKLANLVTLCCFHHRYVHEESMTIQREFGTAAPRWGGERMDYGIGVQVLMEQVAQAADVSAETFNG